MSENDSQPTGDDSQESELVRKLRDEIKQRDAALNEERSGRTQAERKLAFQQVGIDPTKGPGKLLWDAYDGPADADALKAKAAEYEIDLSTPSRDKEDEGGQQQYSEQERAAMQQMDKAAQGGNPDTPPGDPQQAASEAFEREMATSGSRREAMAKSFNARMVTALENQKRGRR